MVYEMIILHFQEKMVYEMIILHHKVATITHEDIIELYNNFFLLG